MQSFYIDAPESCALRETNVPLPGPGEVLLQTRVIGLCGTDLSSYRGRNPLVSYPRIPGHEIGATVVEVGEDVPAEFAPGVNVAVYPGTHCGECASCLRGRTNACKFNQTLGVQRDGALREFFVAPWKKLFRADVLSLAELSLVEPLAVGFHAAARGRISGGDVVAVIGCGMVGLGAIAAARVKGSKIIAIDLDEKKLALACRAGADRGLHFQSEAFESQLLEWTGGHGPDVVIEAVGTPETYTLAVRSVAHTGRVVFVGWNKAPVNFDTKDFVHKELDMLGSRNSLEEFPEVIAMLSAGTFPVEETISARVAMDDTAEALRDWHQNPSRYTKILVEVSS